MSEAKKSRGKIRLVNPYIVGRPVDGTEAFVGRRDIIKSVPELLANPQNTLVIIQGPRRSGKTSTLRQLERTMPRERFEPLFFDLQPYTEVPLGELLWSIAKSVARRIGIEVLKRDEFDNDGRYFEEEFIPKVNEALGDRRLVFLFDEFDVLDPGTEQKLSKRTAVRSFVPFMDRFIQRNPGPALIFAIGRFPEDLSVRFIRLLRYAARSFDVWVLPREDAVQLIKLAEKKGTLKFEDGAVERILFLSGGHPYATQLICSVIWDAKHQETDDVAPTVSAEDVDNSIERSLEAGNQAFAWMWDGLSPAEKIFASALAEVSSGGAFIPKEKVVERMTQVSSRLRIRQVEWAPRDLVKRKILVKYEHGYRFAIELFRLWILKHHPLERTKFEIEQLNPAAHRLFLAGEAMFNTGQYEDAIDLFERAIKQNPRHFSAHLYMGEAYLELGKLDEAIEILEKAYEIDSVAAASSLSRAYWAKASDLSEKKEEDDALEFYKKALKLQRGHDLTPVLNLIDEIIYRRDFEKAEFVLSEFQQIVGELPEITNRFKSVQIERLKTELEKAEIEKDWDRAVEISKELMRLDENRVSHWKEKLRHYEIELEAKNLREEVEFLLSKDRDREVVERIAKLLKLKKDETETLKFSAGVISSIVNIRSPKVLGRGWITDVKFSPDGRFIAVATSIGIWIYPLETQDEVPTPFKFIPTDSVVRSIAFTSDGQFIVSGSSDGTIKVWRMRDGSLIRTLKGHSGSVYSVAISPDGE
ncbi:MAG: hypothetical protein DRQ10_04075, partial [Candidatus Hydrothermota bacterium]